MGSYCCCCKKKAEEPLLGQGKDEPVAVKSPAAEEIGIDPSYWEPARISDMWGVWITGKGTRVTIDGDTVNLNGKVLNFTLDSKNHLVLSRKNKTLMSGDVHKLADKNMNIYWSKGGVWEKELPKIRGSSTRANYQSAGSTSHKRPSSINVEGH